MSDPDPTRRTYIDLGYVFDFLNGRLCGGKSPRPLITVEHGRRLNGFYCDRFFGTRDGSEFADKIALNSAHFREHTTKEIFATVAHEMMHQKQYHEGKPGKGGYHNREWGRMMRAIGLIPTATGKEGGKETGMRVGHLIVPGGLFDLACEELLQQGYELRYVEVAVDPEEEKKRERERQKKRASKTKFTCPRCGANAWGKPNIKVIHADCQELMEPETEEDEAREAPPAPQVTEPAAADLGVGAVAAE